MCFIADLLETCFAFTCLRFWCAQEVCISYGVTAARTPSAATRRRWLHARYLFHCACVACATATPSSTNNGTADQAAVPTGLTCPGCATGSLTASPSRSGRVSADGGPASPSLQCSSCHTSPSAEASVKLLRSVQMAADLEALAVEALDKRDTRQACRCAMECVRVRKALCVSTSAKLSKALDIAARAHAMAGDFATAARCASEHVDKLRLVFGARSMELGPALLTLAQLQLLCGNTREALSSARSADACKSAGWRPAAAVAKDLQDVLGAATAAAARV